MSSLASCRDWLCGPKMCVPLASEVEQVSYRARRLASQLQTFYSVPTCRALLGDFHCAGLLQNCRVAARLLWLKPAFLQLLIVTSHLSLQANRAVELVTGSRTNSHHMLLDVSSFASHSAAAKAVAHRAGPAGSRPWTAAASHPARRRSTASQPTHCPPLRPRSLLRRHQSSHRPPRERSLVVHAAAGSMTAPLSASRRLEVLALRRPRPLHGRRRPSPQEMGRRRQEGYRGFRRELRPGLPVRPASRGSSGVLLRPIRRADVLLQHWAGLLFRNRSWLAVLSCLGSFC